MRPVADLPQPKLMFYKIGASRSNVQVGDDITPHTILGEDYVTGEPVEVDLYGTVMAVNFDGGEHSLTVAIKPD